MPVLDQGAQQVVHIDRCHLQRGDARLEPGKRQQVLDQVGQALALAGQGLQIPLGTLPVLGLR